MELVDQPRKVYPVRVGFVEDNVSVEVLGRITAIAFGRSEPAKKGEEETTDETP